jgi:hypothetical protein
MRYGYRLTHPTHDFGHYLTARPLDNSQIWLRLQRVALQLLYSYLCDCDRRFCRFRFCRFQLDTNQSAV